MILIPNNLNSSNKELNLIRMKYDRKRSMETLIAQPGEATEFQGPAQNENVGPQHRTRKSAPHAPLNRPTPPVHSTGWPIVIATSASACILDPDRGRTASTLHCPKTLWAHAQPQLSLHLCPGHDWGGSQQWLWGEDRKMVTSEDPISGAREGREGSGRWTIWELKLQVQSTKPSVWTLLTAGAAWWYRSQAHEAGPDAKLKMVLKVEMIGFSFFGKNQFEWMEWFFEGR